MQCLRVYASATTSPAPPPRHPAPPPRTGAATAPHRRCRRSHSPVPFPFPPPVVPALLPRTLAAETVRAPRTRPPQACCPGCTCVRAASALAHSPPHTSSLRAPPSPPPPNHTQARFRITPACLRSSETPPQPAPPHAPPPPNPPLSPQVRPRRRCAGSTRGNDLERGACRIRLRVRVREGENKLARMYKHPPSLGFLQDAVHETPFRDGQRFARGRCGR